MTGKRRAGRDPVTPPPSGGGGSQPSGVPTPPPVVIAPQVTRRQARLLRKKQQRKRIGLAGGAAIVAGVLVVAGLGVFTYQQVTPNHHTASRTQSTLLLQIQGSDQTAQASVLLAQDSSDRHGVEVLIPARTITDVCGFGSQNFGAILALPGGVSGSTQALSGMLDNVAIDGSWVLTAAQFENLINKVAGGHLTVDVDVNVVQHTGGGGGQILVPQGTNQTINATQALDYATYTASGQEDASAQLARLQQVVDGLLQALPTSSTTLAADLRLLGKNGASSLGATKLATMLVGLAASFKTADGFYATDLPITPIDSGGAPSYSVDNNPTTGVKALVSTRLAGSQPPGANLPRPRVELLNGVGSPGLVATACPKLAAHNFAYAGSGNSEPFSNANSQITVPGSKLALGYEIASALRLPRSDVLRTTQNQSVADAIVVLGGDYKP